MIENETLVAENVEVDMDTLDCALSSRIHPIVRDKARLRIVNIVIDALYPEDREKLEAYKNQ